MQFINGLRFAYLWFVSFDLVVLTLFAIVADDSKWILMNAQTQTYYLFESLSFLRFLI